MKCPVCNGYGYTYEYSEGRNIKHDCYACGGDGNLDRGEATDLLISWAVLAFGFVACAVIGGLVSGIIRIGR